MSGQARPKAGAKAKQRPLRKVGDDCDTLFSKIVRSRGACQNCGTTWRLQCAHGFSRSYRATRWDEDQCFCLCQKCHVYYTHRQLEWDEWMLDRMGHTLYWEKRYLALSHVKVNVRDLYPVLVARWEDIQEAAA